MPKSAALFESPELVSSATSSGSGVAVTVSAAVLVVSTGAVVVVITIPSMVSDKSFDGDVSDGLDWMVVEVEGSSVGSEVVAASVWDGRDVCVDWIWEGREVS